MDFIGGGIRSSQLKQALSELGVHVQDAEVVNIKLDSGPGRVAEARCGWACLHFRTQEEATDALTGLQSVYMVTDSSPVPRPVLVHWPYWQHRPWGLRGSPFAGHVPDIPTLAHFAQANSLEYELALEWRRLQWTLRDAKLELQKDHTAELAAVMADYKEAVAASKQAAAAGQADAGSKPAEAPTAAPPPPRMSACLWLRGLPDSVSQEVLKRAFAQWLDAPQPLLIEDPATLQARGHAVVRMNSSRHAKQLEDDISTMVFLLGGTPRPVEAATACPGPPSGSLRVYDDALRQTFGSDDHKPLRSVRLVQIEVARSAEEECALRLRAIMERHTLDRAHLRKLANEYRGELHGRHEERIDEEFRKLISLRKMNKQLAGRINQANNNRRKQAPIKLPTRYHRTLGLHVI
ncbi:hypothetical protein WJX72_008841 [[Myrmecia] bisecta]|uniref:RRM domain-containing protein n=1 Tax=[Myrmecia] bisecta TaxID=41462 RepID=A0AAW1QFX3_9CHLO